MKIFSRIFVLHLVVFSACGYQFTGSNSILPEDVKVIAIPAVENLTIESGAGNKFTEALRSRFERYGVVRVVDDAQMADAVLSAKIKKIDERVRNVRSNTDVAVSSDLVVTVSAELKRKNGQVLWHDDEMHVTQSYAGIGDVVLTGTSDFAAGDIGASSLGSLNTHQLSRGQKGQALDDILEEAARQIYDDAVAADF